MTTTNDYLDGHLLLISLGPIQDFIATARRCQDLWFGSWLLSELARTVAASLATQRGVAVVFPAGLGTAEGRPAGVANLILAAVPVDSDVARLAAAARTAQQARLTEIAEKAWANCDRRDGLFLREVAEQQLLELMEFMWVSVPVNGDYNAARTRAYQRLGAIKNTRVWGQPSWSALAGAGVPKSSLDGERESVIHERAFTKASDAARRMRFGTKGQERLCGIGLLKRLGTELEDTEFVGGKPAFHSTAHLAAGPVLRRFKDHKSGQAAAGDLLRAWRDAGVDTRRFRVAPGGPPTLADHDGSLLFESRILDVLENEVDGFRTLEKAAQIDAVGRVAAAQRAALASVDAQYPSPYYAFLLADGDSMGATIDAIMTLEGHCELSDALNRFATGCRGIVQRHEGSLVFAGGDDVLALLPLHTAIACARELADAFVKVVQSAAARLVDPATGAGPPTLSVGLAISHCREPMAEARKLAKRAEGLAKSHPGKNALAVIVAKRGGGDLEAVGSWAEDALDGRMAAWVALVEAEAISAKAAHDLEEVARHFQGLDREAQEARTDELVALARGVLGRKRSVGGESPAEVAQLLSRVSQKGGAPSARIQAMASELQIARMFAEARAAAGLALPVPEVTP